MGPLGKHTHDAIDFSPFKQPSEHTAEFLKKQKIVLRRRRESYGKPPSQGVSGLAESIKLGPISGSRRRRTSVSLRSIPVKGRDAALRALTHHNVAAALPLPRKPESLQRLHDLIAGKM